MPDGTDGDFGRPEGRPDAPGDDRVQPFMLETTGFRGRLLRFGPALDCIVSRHDYPEPVAALLAEMLALAALVSSLLKHDGIFTLQAQGKGPLSLLVADVTHDGKLRGYAQFDREKIAVLSESDDRPSVPSLMGEGYLVYTLDQAGMGERYQGIVELLGDSLADSVQHYFRQSDQVNAGLKLASGRFERGWRAGALLIQELPEEGDSLPRPGSNEEDDWRRALILMSSCTDEELLDRDLPQDHLLYRLFHEEGVRVFEPLGYQEGCRCSRKRIEQTLASMPRADIEDLKVDNALQVVCQFCNREYLFDEADVAALFGDEA